MRPAAWWRWRKADGGVTVDDLRELRHFVRGSSVVGESQGCKLLGRERPRRKHAKLDRCLCVDDVLEEEAVPKLSASTASTRHIGLPGLSRVYRITKVDVDGNRFRLQGVAEDRSQLRRGESPHVEIVVDQGHKIVHVPFVGRQSELPLT